MKSSTTINKVKLVVVNTNSKASSDQLTNNYSCKPRCHACCYRLAQITVAEAMVIYSYLLDNGQWGVVRDKIKNQVSISFNIDPTTWFKMKIECPVLDSETKLCRAYKVRPIFCSTHFVKSDPAACDPWYIGNAPYTPTYLNRVYTDAMKSIHSISQGAAVFSIELPIQTALLLAEKLSVNTGMDFDKIIRMMSHEF